MEGDAASSRAPSMDPLVTVKVDPSEGLGSLCFLPAGYRVMMDPEWNDSRREDTSGLDASEYLRPSELRCRALLESSLNNRLFATCHKNGTVRLWDIGLRKPIHESTDCEFEGPGMLLRRIDDFPENPNQEGAVGNRQRLIYHTRDGSSTVRLIEIDSSGSGLRTIARFESNSMTFCTASPCRGDANLVALPTQDSSVAMVRDWRQAPHDPPVVSLHGAGSDSSDRKHGMLTSLSSCKVHHGGIMLLCGMENGSLFFHDLRMPRTKETIISDSCPISLGQDPILALDTMPSDVGSSKLTKSSLVTIVGLAGDEAEIAEQSQKERGRIVVVKASMGTNTNWSARIRSRFLTLSPGTPGIGSRKLGVSVIRLRPDGRVFAAGGWDRRVRIYSRFGGDTTPLALLRGHSASVHTLDWASDASSSGILATGAKDGIVNIWKYGR